MNVIDVRQALQKSEWLIHGCFQTRGDQGFVSPRIHALVISTKTQKLSGELAISICSGTRCTVQPKIFKTHAVLRGDTMDII